MPHLIQSFVFLCFTLVIVHHPNFAQQRSPKEIIKMVSDYKADIRGPYKDIRWFCPDGSINPPKEPCEEPGGNQRARYKDDVALLGQSNHIYLGQILATTPFADFWDSENYNSRLKQFILEKYLQSVDDGWILQKAQYYRGAIQSEDEAQWGTNFFEWLLKNPEIVKDQFFLVRQSINFIPHGEETKSTLNIRAISKEISDTYPEFQDLRTKIHSQPEASDIQSVKAFYTKHQAKLDTEQKDQFNKLISDLESTFKPVDLQSVQAFTNNLPKDRMARSGLEVYINEYSKKPQGINFASATAEIIAALRPQIISEENGKVQLTLLDISNKLETIFFRESTMWKPQSANEYLEKICYTGMTAMGCGYIETWEWDEVVETLTDYSRDEISIEALQDKIRTANNLVQWGAGMTSGIYKDVVSKYSSFEPLAAGFIDDQIRASVLLPLGNAVGRLGDYAAMQSQLGNKVLDLTNQNSIRGLNPGIAKGKLSILEDDADIVEKDRIYVFKRAPSDLKPVAGILSVSEGNMVSHVQLLARNLGIPNATISFANLEQLKKHDGEEVFYAVAHNGRVIIKLATEMTDDEKKLFSIKVRNEQRVSVPTEKIDLTEQSVINMRLINASSSGKVCGPKAANLGQLKSIFPEHVVEGVVIPFGIFRSHLDQKMPDQQISYWQFLNSSFKKADELRTNYSETAADSFMLVKLQELRKAIEQMPLKEEFIKDLEVSFSQVLGFPLGQIPVFLRSDTNMEDLKDFTGAGLNLTVFNVVSREDIINGIKAVWASPYTERSFSWRQRFLLNPENVFPSILIIPSVDVDYSGVLITKGVSNGHARDITVAFSRGAGGAVEGQAAESYLLHENGENELLAPAREPQYRRLPNSGGTKNQFATFNQRVLSNENLRQLRDLTTKIKTIMPGYMQLDSDSPLDVELGFKDNKIWLFQIRPFVENKNALSLNYLEKMTPQNEEVKIIKMNSPF